MLLTVKSLHNYKLKSLDGDIGKTIGFYFDDLHWTIRYLVADTGNWLSGRQVLISPYALGDVLHADKDITVNLTKNEIENSPPLESEKPVSRQFEEDYYNFYSFPPYWGGPYTWGFSPSLVHDRKEWKHSSHSKLKEDSHLRSTYEVSSYGIEALDGEIGGVEDFVLDDQTWTIRYVIVNTGAWWPGKKVLLSPLWIDSISWKDSRVFVGLSQESIRNSPEYNNFSLLTRDYESKLHHHYHRPGYWNQNAAARVPAH